MTTVNAVGNTLEFVGAPHVRGRLQDNVFYLDAGPLFAESVRRGLMLAPPVENPPTAPCDGVGVEGDEVLLIAHGWKQENYAVEDIGRCVEVWMPSTDWPAIIMGLLAMAYGVAQPEPTRPPSEHATTPTNTGDPT